MWYVIEVIPHLNSSRGPLNKAWTMQDSIIACKLSELPLFQWERLDCSLQTTFFSVFECTTLHDLILRIEKESKAMRLKLCVNIQMLTPVQVALELTTLNLVVFDILSLSYKGVIEEL